MALAGVPLNNVEGVGGIAFNPLAYTAGTNGDANSFFGENISKPQIGLWNIHLHEKGIDWTTFGVAETFFKRVELSYGHETVDFTNSKTINKDNFGAKVLLLSEGDILPAISIGGVFKNTTQELLNSSNSGADYYLVGTKLIKCCHGRCCYPAACFPPIARHLAFSDSTTAEKKCCSETSMSFRCQTPRSASNTDREHITTIGKMPTTGMHTLPGL